MRWKERKQHSLRREIWEEWEARKAVVNTLQAGRQLLMSRDVTHHHNRERLLSSCIRNCITQNGRWAKTNNTNMHDEETWRTLSYLCIFQYLKSSFTLHVYWLVTSTNNTSWRLHKLPLFGSFPGPCGMIPPFLPVWRLWRAVSNMTGDHETAAAKRRRVMESSEILKWRKLSSWRPGVDLWWFNFDLISPWPPSS